MDVWQQREQANQPPAQASLSPSLRLRHLIQKTSKDPSHTVVLDRGKQDGAPFTKGSTIHITHAPPGFFYLVLPTFQI